MVVDPTVRSAEREIILNSRYPSVPFPQLTTTCAIEIILKKIQHTISTGLTEWVTNSITGESIKLPEAEPLSRKVASALTKRGMGKGEVALYLTSDVTRIYVAIMGAWRAGGIMYSSYPEDTQDTLQMRIEESKAKWIFCDPISVPQCKAAIAQVDWPVEIFCFGEVEGTTLVDELFLDDGSACPDRSPNSGLDDPILILCTSGTTGRSKGAVYTNKSLLGFCLGTLETASKKVGLLLLRCTHVLGLLFPIRMACNGEHFVMMHQLTKENIFKTIHEYKPYAAFGFPTFLQLLAIDPDAKKYDLSSLEHVATGGMVIPETFYSTMLTMPNIKHAVSGFGLTECGIITTTVDLSTKGELHAIANHPPNTVGRIYPNMALKVLDLETGHTLGPLERGELAVRSPIMASGYWKRPLETAMAFENGWFKTGDLGYYDEEGFVFIVDRIKETFKYFNNHISPAEIEAEILKHPDVAEVCVFGMEDPNGGDHIPRALAVLKAGAKSTSTEILNFANGRLAEYKQLRGGLFIVDTLPRGKTGKVLRSVAAKIPVS